MEWIIIDDSLDPKRHVRSGNKLIIMNFRLDDMGKYECLAENELMQSRRLRSRITGSALRLKFHG